MLTNQKEDDLRERETGTNFASYTHAVSEIIFSFQQALDIALIGKLFYQFNKIMNVS